jgi:hypothetical protein
MQSTDPAGLPAASMDCPVKPSQPYLTGKRGPNRNT